MSENIAKYEEMLPIPAELIDESQKNIAFVQDSGQAIDLNEQAQPFLVATLNVNEWNEKYAYRFGPVAPSHPKDCTAKHYLFEEGMPISEVQKIMDITDPREIVNLLEERCGMWLNHYSEAGYLYRTLPRK